MIDVDRISKIPELLATVVSDASGALMASSGDIDGEAAGAVNSLSVQALGRTGEELGLGTFQRATVVGTRRTCLLLAHQGAVVGAYVDASRPLPPIEKRLLDTLR